MKEYDLVVIGGGSGGMASAIEAYQNGIKNILILERDEALGGILLQCIHTGFGLQEFKEQLSGPEYAERFANKVNELGIEYKLNTVVLSISQNKEVYYANSLEGYQVVKAKSIILATGCRERNRGAISIPGDRPSGVMTAGLAQKYLNIDGYLVGKKVFILGSGDIGLIMARRMTLEGAKVLGVAELMPYSNGLSRNIAQCLNDFNIPLYLSHTVTNIKGKGHLEQIEISQVDDKFQPIKGTEKVFDVDTLLLSVGLIPSNELLDNLGVRQNSTTRGALVNESLECDIEGIFACGNVLHVHDLVDFVTNEGRRAGKACSEYLKGNLVKDNNYIECVAKNGIGYTVPSRIRLINVKDKVTFNFRVRKPFSNSRIVVKFNDQEVKKVFKPHMLPAEMESIDISKDLLKDNVGVLSFEVVEG